ncbi:hypothetical protein CPT_Silvanus_037 [Stenotrophomonas phage Silvanus]|nr:hypothetical protein CPT_Silvanus_037 [Stenotrophomonas phage Silvanus]
MFVTRKTYNKLFSQAATMAVELIAAQAALREAVLTIVKLRESAKVSRTVPQFTDDQLRELLQLVHPDKHGGKASAIRLTQHINALREK